MGLGLFAVIFVSACAPAVTPTPSTVEVATQVLNPELPFSTATAQPAVIPTEALIEDTAVPTQPAAIQPVATSRGPDLEATDPTTVSLASGGLQFVEFFRFT
jgi:hypothetical protein